jgi:hypothetical protein
MNLTELIEKKIESLGDKAPEYFGKKASTIVLWRKTGKYPIDAVEKVYADTVPSVPPEQPQDDWRAKVENTFKLVLDNQQKITDFVNQSINPEVGKLQKQVTDILASRPQGQSTAPTLGQLVEAQTIERDPNVSHIRPHGTTLQTFVTPSPNSTHPLDTGIAPSKEAVIEQDKIRASGGDPATAGTNRPAGPATPLPGEAAAVGRTGWNLPIERK